jgi:hypothetical protein
MPREPPVISAIFPSSFPDMVVLLCCRAVPKPTGAANVTLAFWQFGAAMMQ